MPTDIMAKEFIALRHVLTSHCIGWDRTTCKGEDFMSRVFIINRKHITLLAAAGIIVLIALLFVKEEEPTALPVTAGLPEEKIYHMVTGEFKTTTAEGEEIEAYRWDPGTIFIEKGEPVKLSIYGVNGESHPFIIEGLNIKGEVKKGQETIVTINTDKEGIYRIICLTHPDINTNGPMIGYIVID
jgi:plastocyanin